MRHHVGILLCVALVALTVVGSAQATGRATQMGTRTSQGGYATTLKIEIPLDDPAKVGPEIEDNFKLLAEATKQAGYTLEGRGRMVIHLSMEAPPQGVLDADLQLFVCEQPAEQELGEEMDLGVVKVEEQKVAYTYHKGGLDGMQATFMKLAQWMMGQGLDFGGYPCVVTNVGVDGMPLQIQMPVAE